MDNKLLPETGFIRLHTILRIIPVSKSTWWKGVKSGKFPKSVKIRERITAWRVEEIKELIKKYSDHSYKSNNNFNNQLH